MIDFKKYSMYKTQLSLCELELKQAKKSDNTIFIETIEKEIEDIVGKMAEIKMIIDNYESSENKNYVHERLFLRCRYVEGMTMEETAEFMKISRNTVYRIKKKIEEQLSS